MSPDKIREAVVATKVELIERMLVGIATLPLATAADFTADPRMLAAGESFLRRALEALLDLGRHLLAKGFGIPAARRSETIGDSKCRRTLARKRS